jgi:hypothetical protein
MVPLLTTRDRQLVNSNPGLPTNLLSFEKQKKQHRLFGTAISLEIAFLRKGSFFLLYSPLR